MRKCWEWFTLMAASLAACNPPSTLPETPRLELSAARVEFVAPEGGYEPPARDVVVTSVGGPLAVTGVSAVYGDGSGWLSFAITDPTASPATVRIRSHAADLAAGTYRATVFVAATGVINSPFPVHVELTVPPPRIVLSADTVRFTVAGGEVPPPYEIKVANAGAGKLAPPLVTVSDPWLSTSIIGAEAPYSVMVQPFLPGAVGVAPFSATLTVTSPSAPEPRTVSVALDVPAPRFALSHAYLHFEAEPGGTLPGPRTIELLPAAPGLPVPTPLIGVEGGWVDVDVTATPGGRSHLVTVTPNARMLALDSVSVHDATIYFVEEDQAPLAGPRAKLVARAWTGPHSSPLSRRLVAIPDALEFTALAGMDPPPQSVVVTDGVVDDVGTLTVGISSFPRNDDPYNGTWLSATTGTVAGRRVVTFQPHVAGLPVTCSRPAACLPYRRQAWLSTGSDTGGVYASLNVVHWGDGGRLLQEATSPTLTALAGGKVLVTSGVVSVDNNRSHFEVLDPAAALRGTAANARGVGHLNELRRGHTATALPDGGVIVAGGTRTDSPWSLASTWEMYEPASGTWRVVREVVTPRVEHTATLLADGRVLLAGGATADASRPPMIAPASPAPIADAEIIDPATGTSTPVAPMALPRRGATAVRLADGKVLVAGGFAGDGKPLSSAELFDPAQGTWSATGPLHDARAQASLVLLQDGRALVAGGTDGTAPIASAEIYAFGGWSGTGSLAAARVAPAVRIPDGRVLMIGGDLGGTVERFDPSTGRWSPAGTLRDGFGSDPLRATADVLSSGLVAVLKLGWPFGITLGSGVTP